MNEFPDTFLSIGIVKIIVGYAVEPKEATNAAYPVSILRWYRNVMNISMECYIQGESGMTTGILDYACIYNKLDLAKFLVDEVGIITTLTRFDSVIGYVDQSSNYGNVIDINWDPFRNVIASGHIEMISWIIERFRLTRDDPYNRDRWIVADSIVTGRLKTVILIVDKLGFHRKDTKEHLMDIAKRHSFHDIAKWLENCDGLK